MPKITFNSAHDSGKYVPLRDDADLTKYKSDALVEWEFDTQEEDTLSLIRADDGVFDFKLRRDESGLFNQNSYQIAYTVSYAKVHILSYRKGETRHEKPSPDQIATLPLDILRAYLVKARTGIELKDVLKGDDEKKEAPANPDS